MPVDCLHLVIEAHSCICGNKWTHSYQLYSSRDGSAFGCKAGGEMKLPTISATHEIRPTVSACFNCIGPAALSAPVHPDFSFTRGQKPAAKPLVDKKEKRDFNLSELFNLTLPEPTTEPKKE